MNRNKRIEIRASIFEEKLIRAKARDTGLSLSEYMRHCALNKTVPKQLDENELEAYRNLKKYYNNFSSISNLLKQGNHQTLLDEIAQLQKELMTHLKLIRYGK